MAATCDAMTVGAIADHIAVGAEYRFSKANKVRVEPGFDVGHCKILHVACMDLREVQQKRCS